MPPDERTYPGDAPGIYSCDYLKLTRIMAALAGARVHVLQGDLKSAQVRLPLAVPARALQLMAPAAVGASMTMADPTLCMAWQQSRCFLS